MATGRLTFAQCWTMLYRLVNLLNVQFHTLADGTALTTAGNNYTTLEDTFTKNLGGIRSRDMVGALDAMRTDSVDFLVRGRELMRSIILEMARSTEVASPAGDNFARAFRDVWLYMHSNKWVRRRLATFGSPAVVSATGTGTMYRCTKDEKGYNIESAQADTITAECKQDKTSGTSSGLEIFELRGTVAGKDILEQLGIGLTKRIVASSEGNSILDTPGFEDTFASSGTSLVGSWETDDATKFARSSTAFRGSYSCSITAATSYVRQPLTNIDRSRPYLALLRYKDNASRTGTLRLTLGSKTKDATLGSDSNWHDLMIDLDDDCWPNNWINSTPYFQFHCTSLGGSGDLLVDSCVLKPLDEFAGLYYALTAGATDWLAGNPGDRWSVTDSFSNVGVIQFWVKLLLGLYFPHKQTGSYNLTDPTLV